MWIMPGRRKERVFPLPVVLMPTIFLPRRAMGHPWDWMGVGASKPCFMTSLRTYSGILACDKRGKVAKGVASVSKDRATSDASRYKVVLARRFLN